MTVETQIDIARLSRDHVKVAHLILPPYEAADLVNASAPGAIAVGYCGQKSATLQTAGGRTFSIDVAPGDIGLTGPEPVRWLRLNDRAEVVEIAASPALRQEIAAELGVERFRDLDDLHGWKDACIWGIVSRFRHAARKNISLTDVQCDEFVHQIYARVFQAKFGAPPFRRAGELDQQRLRRVTDFVEAHLAESLTLSSLAQSAALSPFHFARAFKRTTGWAPHQFVTIRRLEHARYLLLRTRGSVEMIANAVRFSNPSHFRRLFRVYIGALPSDLRGGRLHRPDIDSAG
jgi:AraC family transcriptional regulator